MVSILNNSNLLNVTNGIICHQTNCVSVMGGGIALQIRNKWPSVFNQYCQYCKAAKLPDNILGTVQCIKLDDNLYIANCFGQIYPGYGLMTRYDAWDDILDKLMDLSIQHNNLPIHLPWMIGCGLAGGDWNIMYNKIKTYFDNTNIPVYIHNLT